MANALRFFHAGGEPDELAKFIEMVKATSHDERAF
jgi:hypothetical protein